MHPSISTLTFGAEFEVVSPLDRDAAARRVSEISGLPVFSGFGGCPRGSWKIVNDGSIRGNGRGLEFVSPVLSGDAGLEQVAKIARALNAAGCAVNTSTGFHVHVGAPTNQIAFFQDLLKLYGRYEDAIDGIMAPSRRGNGADYCKSVKVDRTAIESATSVTALSHALARASGAGRGRYHKINIEGVHSKGGLGSDKPRTVEFRQHAGTVKAETATGWIVTCLKLVAAAKAGRIGDGAMIAIDQANFALKTRAMLEMCGRSEGATIREICERFGFSTISVKRHARLAGVPYRQAGQRYYVTAAQQNGGAPATLDDLCELIDATADERAFLQSRAAVTRS